jgi:SAM-dependent methyltransferase
MDATAARLLCELNNRFYQRNSASFAATRQGPWPGWKRCLELCRTTWGGTRPATRPLTVLDLACGNLRFERYLARAWPECPVRAYAVDACAALLPTGAGAPHVSFQELDVIDALLGGTNLARAIAAPACDLGVCFGFMHHVPSQALRLATLQALMAKLRPGGIAIITFWRYLADPGLAARAAATDAQALAELGLSPTQLDPGDHLLGWQGTPGAWRYCHSFTDAEISELASSIAPASAPLARFEADGRNGALNTYLVLQR